MSEQRNSRARRCIGAVLFVFVFTLPFHFHPVAENRQVSQECSCYYSGRTQLGPTPAPVVLAPVYEVKFLITSRAETPAQIAVESESARGPPPQFNIASS
jgi:hypothetical protein